MWRPNRGSSDKRPATRKGSAQDQDQRRGSQAVGPHGLSPQGRLSKIKARREVAAEVAGRRKPDVSGRVRASIPRRAGASLTTSFGVATLDPGRDRALVDSAALMRIADAALYEAKRSGRNRVVAVPAGPPRGLQIDAAGRTVG